MKLALQTLGTFDWGRMGLLEFMRDHVLPFTDDADKETRQAAVLACAKVGQGSQDVRCVPLPWLAPEVRARTWEEHLATWPLGVGCCCNTVLCTLCTCSPRQVLERYATAVRGEDGPASAGGAPSKGG